MKLSKYFFVTRKENPSDEGTIAAKLLIKSGMIYKNDIGTYTYLPMGLKVLDNIKKIIREEMNNVDANELLMPSLVSSDVFALSNRYEVFGDEIFNIKGRNKDYALCPTHEELFTSLAKNYIQSYKDLHFTLFQISNKYRDEVHPEFGLVRKKEFLMADAYSFDANDGGLDISYDKMYMAFKHILDRFGLDYITVGSDPTSMMGESSEEFQVISEYGDNEVVKCNNCNFAINREDAPWKNPYKMEEGELKKLQTVNTPNIRTIKEISKFLHIDESNIIKSLVIKVDETYKMILLRGNSQLNINKLKKVLKTSYIEMPSKYELELIGTSVGYIGPIGCTMEIIADSEIKSMTNAVCGANKKNKHCINVTPGRDFRVTKYADIKLFDEKGLCPKCKSNISIVRGVEVAHIFKLGSSYSKKYNLKYSDEKNQIDYVHMGSYGIGLDRCMAAIVEKYHDDKGIIWPYELAPFKVEIIVVNVNDANTYDYSKDLYKKLNHNGIDTIIDDRKESLGTKYSDAELMGIPIIIVVGKKFATGNIELKVRSTNEIKEVKINDAISEINKIIKDGLYER